MCEIGCLGIKTTCHYGILSTRPLERAFPDIRLLNPASDRFNRFDRQNDTIKMQFDEIKTSIKSANDTFLINNNTSSLKINKVTVTFGEIIDLTNIDSIKRAGDFIRNISQARYNIRMKLNLRDTEPDEIINTIMTRITRFYVFKVVNGYVKEVITVYPNVTS